MRFLAAVLTCLVFGAAAGGVAGFLRVGESARLEQMIDLQGAAGAIESATDPGPASQTTPSGPRVYVALPNYDFGVMQKGTTLSHEFELENRGDEPLELTAGQPSCKCTIGEVPKDPVPPGGKVLVKVTWTAKIDPGEFRQTAPILTNDLKNPRVELQVFGNVIRTSGLEPQDFDFGRVRVGKPAEAEAVLTSTEKDSFKLTVDPVLGEDGEPLIVAETIALGADELPAGAKSGYRINLKSSGRMPLGYFSQLVTMQTDLPDLPKFEPYVRAMVEGDFSIRGRGYVNEEDLLKLGFLDSRKGARVKLLLVVRGEHAEGATLELASTDPDVLQVTIGEPRRAKTGVTHFPVELVVPPGLPPMARLGNAQSEDGQVRFRSNHPDTPEFGFRVRFAVR